MKNKEIEELLNELKEYASGGMSGLYPSEDTVKNFVSYIEQLEKENKILRENAEHNDKVVDKVNWENQQLKKQKDDVVELIKKQLLSNTNITKYTDEMCLRDVLRMLGETDE